MACDNITLPSALDSSGLPFIQMRLIDSDCGCGTLVPGATIANCAALADITLVDPIPVLEAPMGGFIATNGVQMGDELLVATIVSLQCCYGNVTATEALSAGATLDTEAFTDEAAQLQVVIRWRRGVGTLSGNVYARLVFLDVVPFTVTPPLPTPYDIPASAGENYLYLCGTLLPENSARIQVGYEEITVS